jgi:cytochrome c
MKITNLLLVVLLISFSSFAKVTKEAKYYNSKIKSNSPIQTSEGEKLISRLDCVGCHHKSMKILGPSYLDIAKKYDLNDKNINYLTSKIIKGGSGVWGNIPMAAHSNLKKEDAKTIVKYILSLKK